jgi:carboxyl-terminal processing protease
MLDPDKKIGYIWLRQFNQNAVKEMRTAVDDLTKQGMKGLVLDLSMDPGGLLDVAVEIGSMFIDHGPIVWTQNRGEEARSLNAIPGNAISKNVKIVTLIDGGSASASEIVAGALQDTGRATLVGQRSFGKAKVQTICELQDDSALFLSTALYLTPKKWTSASATKPASVV